MNVKIDRNSRKIFQIIYFNTLIGKLERFNHKYFINLFKQNHTKIFDDFDRDRSRHGGMTDQNYEFHFNCDPKIGDYKKTGSGYGGSGEIIVDKSK